MTTEQTEPILSVVLIVYDMPRQAMNSIRSLIPPYQTGVSSAEYELVVVENRSHRCLDPQEVEAQADNVRYFARDEASQSPAAACNFGVAQARGRHVALMIDGARLATPGVVRQMLAAFGLHPEAAVATPGYHLGAQLQRSQSTTGYGEREELALLARVGWPQAGYGVFQEAVLSGSCSQGFLAPMSESNCLGMSRLLWDSLGGVDERYRSLGGGFVNLDLYRRAVEAAPELVVLPGEGTFHQFHGGATTGREDVNRQSLLEDMEQEYVELRGGSFRPPQRQPILYGTVGREAAPFLGLSADAVHNSR